MSIGNFFQDDLFEIYNITQGSMILHAKEVIISSLRDYFSQSLYFHFEKDAFGFSKTINMTGIPLGKDIPDQDPKTLLPIPGTALSTRLHIGENYRFNVQYFPCLLIKYSGGKYIPTSLNRDQGTVEYETIVYTDGYNSVDIRRPVTFVTNGSFESTITIDIRTRSLKSRDDLVEMVTMFFTEIAVESLQDVGIVVKMPSLSATSETPDRSDLIYAQSITLDIRTEWQRKIPVKNLIDTILFTVQFKDIDNPNAIVAPNLTINTELSINDVLNDMLL